MLMRLPGNEKTRDSAGDELSFYFALIKAPANLCPTFPTGKGFQRYYNMVQCETVRSAE